MAMTVEHASRTEQRQGFGESVRVALLESDADRFESAIATGFAEMRSLLFKIFGVLVTLLISVTTAAILFALRIGN